MMRSMESTDSSSGSAPPQRKQQPGPVAVPAPYLPPGFRFHPTDEELVVHYLKKKAASMPLPVTIIAEVDLYKFDPWELPEKASFGTEQEWYFFSPRDRKYPNGARPNRAATSGYWKATGTDKPIMASGGSREKVGVKKALVFYRGKPPKGLKTNWIMHEYRLTDAASSTNTSRPPPGSGGGKAVASLRLDDWVLCRIYKKINKHGVGDQLRNMECGGEGSVEDAAVSAYPSHAAAVAGMTLGGANYTSLLHHHHEDNFLDGLLTTVEDGGGLSAAGAASLSQLAAVTRASNTAVTKQLLAPLAAATPFNWLDASSSGIAILPPAKRYHGFSRGNADGSTSLSSPAAEGNQLPAGSIDDAGGSGTAAIPTTFLNPLGGVPGATTTYHHHAILGTSSLPPETAFQHPYQLTGVNWNP